MTKHERAKLRSEMRRIMEAVRSSGGRFTVAQVYERMVDEIPDMMEEAKETLFRLAMNGLIRKLFKEMMRADDEIGEVIQLSLFGNSAPRLEVPRYIALVDPEGGGEMIWVPTLSATLNEVTAHIRYLQTSIKADSAKMKKLTVFRDHVVNIAASDDLDTPINELLCGLQEARA